MMILRSVGTNVIVISIVIKKLAVLSALRADHIGKVQVWHCPS